MQTFSKGFEYAKKNKKNLFISQGNYRVNETIMIQKGTSIFGSYDGFPKWEKLNQIATSFECSTSPSIIAEGIDEDTYLEGVQVIAPDKLLDKEIRTSIALMIVNSQAMKIYNCKLISASGYMGQNGSPHDSDSASNGGDGELGESGCEAGSLPVCKTCSEPKMGRGGSSSCGASGGDGGKAGSKGNDGNIGKTGENGGLPGMGLPFNKGDINPTLLYCGQNGTDGSEGA